MSPTPHSGDARGPRAEAGETRGRYALTYLGWSGFRISAAGSTPVFIDPPRRDDLPGEHDVQILLTHGHPEHVAGTIRYLADGERWGRATVLASPRLIKALARHVRGPGDRLLACRPGQTLAVGGIGIDVFAWRHMTLLPAGLKASLTRLRQLARRPGVALRIARRAARIPRPGPMLGFRITLGHAPRLLFFGEGLHQKADVAAVEHVAVRLPAEIGVIAAEPEDMDVLPGLIAALGVRAAVLFEAHGPWRDAFAMGRADLPALGRVLAENEVIGVPVTPGEAHDLGVLAPNASAPGLTG